MNARVGTWRWANVGLLVGLMALLATVNVQAMDATKVYSVALLASHCDTLFIEEGDPFAAVEEADAPCADLAAPNVSSVEFAGNAAWVWAEVDGKTELRVYLNRNGAWEHIAYSSEPDQAYLDLLERENEFMREMNPGAAPAVASPGIAVDPRGENYWAELLTRAEAAPAAAAVVSPGIAADPRGENYWAEVFARQEGSAAVTATSSNVSIDRRGESYWNELLATQEGSAAVTTLSHANIPFAVEADLIGMAEREVGFSGGSQLNTLADLLRELYGSAWDGQFSGSEDLARELE